MTAPRLIPGSLEPARIISGEAETQIGADATPSGDLHRVNPDAYTAAGKSAAAKAMVGVQRSARSVPQSVGLSPLLDAASALARTGYETRIVSEASANEVALALDQCKSGFEVRLVHLLLERTVDHALIGTRARQRLSSSLNNAFSRTGERFSQSRPSNVDSLGLLRGEQGFTDTLIESLTDRGQNRTAAVVTAVKQTKSKEALGAAFDAVAKLLHTGVFSKSDRIKVLSAFLQAQGRLRTSVVPMAMGVGAGLMTLQVASKERSIDEAEARALGARMMNAPIEALEQMRQQVVALVRPPLFQKGEARAVLAEAEQRLMMLRAL